MNNDQIAVYLIDHPEFFNKYPELLEKIKSIDIQDLPLPPSKTISMTNRILKKANLEKENFKTMLEWLIDIAQGNEKIQNHLLEIEQLLLTSADLDQVVIQLKNEIPRRFEIPHVCVCFVDGGDYFMESSLKEKYFRKLKGAVKFIDQPTASRWFQGGLKPVLRWEVKSDSEVFDSSQLRDTIKSEALIPIIVGDAVAGAIALGSPKPFHFHEGLRTDYLERMAEKLAIAIDNTLLMDRLKNQSVVDRETGLYNQFYLEPALFREFDRARRNRTPLSCLQIQVDCYNKLTHTYGNPQGEKVLKNVGKVLTENCRSRDILVRSQGGEFIVLLPEINHNGAAGIAQRIRKNVGALDFKSLKGFECITLSIGIAAYPDDAVRTRKELIQAAAQSLAKDQELGKKRAVS